MRLKTFFFVLCLGPLNALAYIQQQPGCSASCDPQASQMSNDSVRLLMIAESIRNYPGDCACPYCPDKIGGICGTESAYYRLGSDYIKCYLRDISSKEVYFFRLRYATPNARAFSQYFNIRPLMQTEPCFPPRDPLQ